MQGRLQPLAGAHFALVAKAVRVAPSAAPHQQLHRLLNLQLVGIALVDHRLRNAVCAENDLGSLRICEPRQRLVNLFGESLQVEVMPVEIPNAMYGKRAGKKRIAAQQSVPFVQAAARGGARVLRIKRKQDHFIALRRAKLRDGFAGKRMPITHGDETACVETGFGQGRFQSAGLPLGEPPDGRASADHRVMMLDFFRTGGGNQLGKRSAAQAGERKIDNVGVGKEIKKERFNGFQSVGSAELEENYTNTPSSDRHSPESLEDEECYPM